MRALVVESMAGATVVSLEPASIQVRRTARKGKLLTGMFQFHPSPVRVPYNCPRCSDDEQAIRRPRQDRIIPLGTEIG